MQKLKCKKNIIKKRTEWNGTVNSEMRERESV